MTHREVENSGLWRLLRASPLSVPPKDDVTCARIERADAGTGGTVAHSPEAIGGKQDAPSTGVPPTGCAGGTGDSRADGAPTVRPGFSALDKLFQATRPARRVSSRRNPAPREHVDVPSSQSLSPIKRVFSTLCPNCQQTVKVPTAPVYQTGLLQVLAQIEKIAPQALELGWTQGELFAMRSRVDLSGLVSLMSPGDVIEGVTTDAITIRTMTGVVQRFYRRQRRAGSES